MQQQQQHVSPAESVTFKSDYRTDGRTDRQTPDKVIPMCRYASQATQKLPTSSSLSLFKHTFNLLPPSLRKHCFTWPLFTCIFNFVPYPVKLFYLLYPPNQPLKLSHLQTELNTAPTASHSPKPNLLNSLRLVYLPNYIIHINVEQPGRHHTTMP